MEDYEEGEGLATIGHMVAGSAAGVAEHCVFFPVDTIKTRMQTMSLMPGTPQYSGVFQTLVSTIRIEGLANLYRGMTAVLAAAIPSHAIYFGVYEGAKLRLQTMAASSIGGDAAETAANMAAGAIATSCHDAIVTPLDVIKQRLQIHGSPYSGVRDVAVAVYAKHGLRAFYASYPTTLVMNVPHFAVYFGCYEAFKKLLVKRQQSQADPNAPSSFSPLVHCAAGAGAGAMAAAVSNPMDVIKTRLQTMGEVDVHHKGFKPAARAILESEGPKGFLRGVSARVLYSAPSAALVWLTYEYMKYSLSAPAFGDFFLAEPDKFHHLHE